MAAAYAFADGGPTPEEPVPAPEELVLLGYLDRFGVQAVMGRALGAGEIRRMTVAENIVKWYRERQASSNWASWATDNPDSSQVLLEAQKLAIEFGLIEDDSA